MATYVKGDAVANATSYELFENVNGEYNSLATANEINFDVSALGLAGGDHSLVVKAKADGYEDSEYSNAVVYSVPLGAYWISEKLTDTKVGSGTPTSMLNTQYFYIEDETYLAELTGKTVEAIAVGTGNKAVEANIILALVPLDNTLPTEWQEVATIPMSNTEDTLNTVMIFELETPFTVPEGYTLGYRSSRGNVFGGGTVNGEYKRTDKYYNSATATSTSPITMCAIDCKVK